jgi:hypothetical protein
MSFLWREFDHPENTGSAGWSIFARTVDYFDQAVMVNYRVENLDAVLDELRSVRSAD